MSGIDDAVGGVLGKIEKCRRGDAVGTEPRQIPSHLLDLAMDERAFRVARPFHERVRVGRADPGQLPGEVEVAAGISLLGRDAHAVLLGSFDECVGATFAEVVIDVEESEAFELRHFLVDEVDHVTYQLAVRHGRAEYPLVALRRDALSSPAHHDLRHLFLSKYLRRGQACRAAHAADGERDLIAAREAARHDGRLFGLAGVVADHDFDRPAEQAAGGILQIDGHLDRFAYALSLRCGIARHRAEGTDLGGTARLRPTAGADQANAVALAPAPRNLRRFMVMIVLPRRVDCHDIRTSLFRKAAQSRRSTSRSLPRSFRFRAEIAGPYALVGEKLCATAAHGDVARLHHVGAVRKTQRQVGILLDQEYGHAGIAEYAN